MTTKPPQICIFDNEQQYFCTLCTCTFHLLKTFSFFLRREMSCFAVVWTTWAYIWWQMFNFVFLCPKRWFQINSRTVRGHFSSIMTLNNWKMIAETRNYIFIWRSRLGRRLVCLSSLIAKTNCSEQYLRSLKWDSLHVLFKRHFLEGEKNNKIANHNYYGNAFFSLCPRWSQWYLQAVQMVALNKWQFNRKEMNRTIIKVQRCIRERTLALDRMAKLSWTSMFAIFVLIACFMLRGK